MISTEDFAVIAALDLDAIKAKLTHKKGGKGWSLERANAIEREYRRFLYLMKKFPNEPTAPLVDVDTFWHYHILDTLKYAADCQQVFGYFLHHFPYVGMRGKEDEEALQRLGERMRTIYEETFGDDYLAAATASEVPSKHALSSGINLGAAYGAMAHAETSTDSANCTRAIAEAAYCIRVAAESAYCIRVAAEPAYCIKPVVDAAYCIRVATEPAYRVKPAVEAAYCIKPALEAAYCISSGASEPEQDDGTLAVAEAAYCIVTNGDTQICPPARDALPEQRAAFYLERPRLPAV